MNIEVSLSAIQQIQKLIAGDSSGSIALRISVDGGGCSGFSYKYALTDTINSDDFVYKSDSIQVVIDSISQPFLSGSVLEFVKELGASYFQIKNPNATAKCGCGNSFAI